MMKTFNRHKWFSNGSEMEVREQYRMPKKIPFTFRRFGQTLTLKSSFGNQNSWASCIISVVRLVHASFQKKIFVEPVRTLATVRRYSKHLFLAVRECVYQRALTKIQQIRQLTGTWSQSREKYAILLKISFDIKAVIMLSSEAKYFWFSRKGHMIGRLVTKQSERPTTNKHPIVTDGQSERVGLVSSPLNSALKTGVTSDNSAL